MGERADYRIWAILNRFGVLSHLPAASQAELLESGRILAFSANHDIHRQGEKSRGLWCILDGQLRFSSVDEAGREFVILTGFPGSWFGQTLFDDGPVIASATTMVASKLFHVPADRAGRLAESDAHIARFVTRSLIWAGRMALNRLQERMTLPNAALVASLLRYHLYGGASGTLRLSQADMALACGISPKTVNRVLRDMKAKGIIEVSYQSVTIRDAAALDRLAADIDPDTDFEEGA